MRIFEITRILVMTLINVQNVLQKSSNCAGLTRAGWTYNSNVLSKKAVAVNKIVYRLIIRQTSYTKREIVITTENGIDYIIIR